MIYPDASVIIAAVVREPMTGRAIECLRGADAGGITTSDWTLTEIASALAIKQRTGQLSERDRHVALDSARTLMAASFIFVAIGPAHCRAATGLIERSTKPLRGGDALHLAIAGDARATLWTLDRKMAEAGQALALDVRLLA